MAEGETFFSVFLAAFFAALLAEGLLRWWQYRRDLWIKHGDEFCSLLQKFADAASQYWAMSRREDAELVEAALLGLQTKVDGIWAVAKDRLDDRHRQEIENSLAKLSRAATGGQFQSRRRQADRVRIQQCQQHCADAVVSFWNAGATAMTIGGTLRFLSNRGAIFIAASIIAAFALGYTASELIPKIIETISVPVVPISLGE